jgi:hypothetical protein
MDKIVIKYGKLVLAFFIMLMVSPLALALGTRSACTPPVCPSTYWGTRVTSTSFNTSWTANSYDNGTCGTNYGDLCIRTCYMNQGCWGGFMDSQAFGTYTDTSGYVQKGFVGVDWNNYCYQIRSYASTQASTSGTSYDANHNFNFSNVATSPHGIKENVFNLASWTRTGTALRESTKYIWVKPEVLYGIGGFPSGYDLTFYVADDIATKTMWTRTGGSGTITGTALTELVDIPVVNNYYNNDSYCVQNAPLDLNEFKFYINGIELSNTIVKNIVKPSNGLYNMTIIWRDDSQDDGKQTGWVYAVIGNDYYTVVCNGGTGSNNMVDFSNYSCILGVCTINYNCNNMNGTYLYTGINKIKLFNAGDKYYIERGGGSVMFSEQYSFNLIDTPLPVVTLNSPSSGVSYATGSYVNFNYTVVSSANINSTNTLFIGGSPYFSGVETNGTSYNHSYQFNTPGTYNWYVQAQDSVGTGTSETRNFTIISVSNPTISSYSVTNPANVGTLATLVANATVVPGSYPIASVNLYLTPALGGPLSMTNIGGNLYQVATAPPASWATNQNYNITACDTSGFCTSVIGTTQINHYPSFVSQNVNPTSPSTYNPSLTTAFNSTWNEDISLSVCTFALDGTAYSATRIGNTCSYSVVGLSAGNHNYGWNVVDIGGLTNQTAGYPNSYSYTVNKATPTIIHSVSPSSNVASGIAVSGSCNVANNTGSSMTYNRCTLQTSASQASPGTLTFGPVTPSIGTYTCNCSVASSANWNYAQNIITLSVTGSTPPNVTNLRPLNATIINSGTVVSFNATAVANSYPIAVVSMALQSDYTIPPGIQLMNGNMNSIGGNVYQKNVTILESWSNYIWYFAVATDTQSNFGQNYTIFINNHAPTYSNVIVSPAQPVQYSPSRVYSFNATWVDDLYSVTGVNVTIDGTNHVATNVVGNIWQYNITGLSYGQHNYTWTAVDTYGATRTTPVQFYSVGTNSPIFTISINPSVSVISGTQTNASCVADVNVTPQLWRNGASVSNPDVQTLSSGQYTYLCNFTPSGNYSYSYTTDLLIVNPPNAQTQSQFCDGQLDKTYTYTNGGENYTMCVNVPCGSNVTSATVDLTGLVLNTIKNYFINMFGFGTSNIINCGMVGSTLSQVNCTDSNITNAVIYNGRIHNSTIMNNITGYKWNVSNVIIQNAYVLNGKLISGTITYNENGQVQFDT